jgi:hypothetical protein
MVTDKLQRFSIPFRRGFLLLMLLGVGSWVGLGWAGQQAPPAPRAPASKARKATPKKQAARVRKATPARGEAASAIRASKEMAAEISGGRRDPFKPLVFAKPGAEGEMITGPLPPGKRGLLISQLLLEGIVRLDTSNQMIAVVTNYTKRAYFLRENDAVYNGVVGKITPDSVTFQENIRDANGRVVTREVVKRLSPAPGEGR